MKRRMVAMMLAAMMAVSLTACGSEGETTAAAGDTTAAADTVEDTAAVDTSDLEPITLIGGDNAGAGAAAQLYGELFSQTVEELSGGLITVNYQPNGALGSDTDMQQQMLDGDMDFVICQTAPTATFVSAAAIFDLPMVFAQYDGDTIGTVLNDSEFSDALKAAYEENNFRVLHFLQGGTFRETTSNVALNTLEDYNGLLIRTMENSNHMAFWTALGAAPTPLTWGEVYITLQNGGLDAQENATDTIVGANLQEVQDYLILTHHILYCNQLLFNNETFTNLPQQYQDWLNQAAAEAAEEIEAQLIAIDEESRATLEEGGMQIIEYDDAFIEEVLALEGVQQLYADIDSQVGGGLVAMLQEALASADQ